MSRLDRFVSDVATGDRVFRVFDSRFADPTPRVFLHGNSSRWQDWLPQAEHFRQHHRVIAFDHVGFGASSPMPEGYSMLQQYADAKALLRVLGVERCHVVGMSMGAAGAQLFGLHGELAVSLVLAASMRYDRVHPAAVARWREIREKARRQPVPDRETYASMVFGAAFRNAHPELIDQGFAEVMKTDFSATAALMSRESLAGLGRLPVSNIRVPCLVISGVEDYQMPPETSHDLHEALANSRWCPIEN
ncbi:MAG TPA: alpha/beta hydrolase, partial [Pseudomonadales bacterium]